MWGEPWGNGWGMHGGMGWGGLLLAGLLALLIIAVVAVGAVWILRRRADGGQPRPGQVEHGGVSDAERVLNERFARGDIDEEEYQRRRTILQQK
ncbi:putative membrane protein [Microlunatus panaciterrae]|uniref:Membrane protein n=1 Tax=Microlunatus panaciterrae TaxID=400768 RepID=A0ABS2RH00_9ACTN|nr:SHOCT domain-containing protein [Microlunatus panaciterrae]MBM7797209.1 putative membrane protein [Microlunatus panaciterrae]